MLTNTGTGFGGREGNFQSFGYYDLISTATGQAYGTKFLVQKKFSDIPVYGIFSLTYSQSEVTTNNGTTSPGQSMTSG